MTRLQDLYTTRLVTNHTETKRQSGEALTINFQVDLISALNNIPSSPQHDATVPMQSGVLIRVTYRTPTKYLNIADFSFKEQAERFIETLKNPDSDIYNDEQENPDSDLFTVG